jgi:2-oxoglutarate ferredoxin oxidoreductase subunit alpha
MKDATFNILIGGEAGQGLITVGQILSRILVRSGYFIVVTQSYHSRIRGGHNTFAIRVGHKEIAAPAESVDILVALNKETASIHRKELSPGGIIILEEALEVEGDALLKVPFKKLAHDRFSNVVALGVAGCLLGLKEKSCSVHWMTSLVKNTRTLLWKTTKRFHRLLNGQPGTAYPVTGSPRLRTRIIA